MFEKILESILTAWRSNQSILKEINPDYSLERLMLKLKASWCKELTHWKRPRCWERLRAREEGGDRGWEGWMVSLTQCTWVWVNSGSWWWTGRSGVLLSMGSQRIGHDWASELNWTKVGQSFSSKEQASCNFMVAVCSDFEAQKDKVSHCTIYFRYFCIQVILRYLNKLVYLVLELCTCSFTLKNWPLDWRIQSCFPFMAQLVKTLT